MSRLSSLALLALAMLACERTDTPEAPAPEVATPSAPDEAAAVPGDDAQRLGPPSEAFASIQLWIPGDLSADDALPKPDQALLALCRSTDWTLGKASIEAFTDPMVDMEGEQSGRRLKGPCEAAALLGNMPEPNPSAGRTWKTGALEAGKPHGFRETDGIQLVHRRLGDSGYAVDLVVNGTPWNLVAHQSTDDGSPSLHWAGDIDGDGKLDLILNETPKYSYSLYALYLSSAATKGPVARIVEVQIIGD